MDILFDVIDIGKYYIQKYLLKHPQDVCMTYIEHFSIAIYIAYFFMKGCIKSIIHAFIPSFFLTSSGDTADEIKEIIKENGCRTGITDNEKKEN